MLTIFWSQGMSDLSQYFHLVSTKCKMNKILDLFIYLKYNKTNLKMPFKSQDGNKYLQLNLIDYILPHLGFPVNLSFNMLPQTLNVFSLHVYIYNLLFLFLIYIENFRIWIKDVLFFFYLILTELWNLGRSNRGHN